MMRVLAFLVSTCLHSGLMSQSTADTWMHSQLGKISWEGTYEGVLADYHPISMVLASDGTQIAGYLIHKGDNRSHRLYGDWNKDKIQLQERDEYDRLTGYLKGTITNDQVNMEWMSADQSRIFSIIAFPKTLIKIKNFKPYAEWIEVGSTPPVDISVQKMDYGIVSGTAHRNGNYSRFEGYCLDGTCSIWNTVIQNQVGAPIRVQMRQKDALSYKSILEGKEYPGVISTSFPLNVRLFDNSSGFLDFVYPELGSESYDQWVSHWVDKSWTDGVNFLTSINQSATTDRLIHRSTGWIEILDAGENYVSGMATYINPGGTRREGFVWMKKEDIFLTTQDLLNAESDLKKACTLALSSSGPQGDSEYDAWLHKDGYKYLLPTHEGVVMLTDFNMIYGDDIHLLPMEQSKELIKKKYWKNFGWQ